MIKNLIAIGADNCNTMQGIENGVAALLKRECPFLIHIGCIAHLLNLSVKDLFDDEEGYAHLIEFDQLIKDIYSFFSSSPKKLINLKKWYEM